MEVIADFPAVILKNLDRYFLFELFNAAFNITVKEEK
jgi:hypothetical protein